MTTTTHVPTDTNRLWSRKETAAYLGVGEQTLSNWQTLGRGPRCLHVGRRVMYRPLDVELWLEQTNS
ncbi:helix-turn-helix domain-containing protein [Williamsia herbipolensis]|uniref:helix-turn-helix transcriptional regulator n=1 Tax=Williamsia herbipolensis TaxID=1603258 RepID=UPI0009E46326